MASKQTTDTRTWPWTETKDLISPTSYFDPPSLFAKTISTNPLINGGSRILDIGCGSGIVGLYSLVFRNARHVIFHDLQEEAIEETKSNVDRHIAVGTIQNNQVDYIDPCCSVEEIPKEKIYTRNLLLFNPPQLPGKHVSQDYLDKLKINGQMHTYRDGGEDGLDIARKFFVWYANLDITKRPKAVILLSSFLGRRLIDEVIRGKGFGYELDYEILQPETEVPLRYQLKDAAENLAEHATEINDRSITKRDNQWYKKLLTISLSHRK